METEGIVLKSKNLGDRLRHLSVYARKLGKINLIVKVKASEFPLKYEPFSITLFKLQQKGEKWEVLEGKLLKENFPKNREEFLYRSKVARLIAPLELPPNEKLYRLIEKYVAEEGAPPTYTAFLMKFIFVEGLMPRLFRCVKCGSPAITHFSVKQGGVVCKKCYDREDIRWNRETSKEAHTLTKEPLNRLKTMDFKWLNLIETAAEKHLRYRTEK